MVQEEEIRAPALNRSLSNQRLPQQYQAPGLPMAGRPPTATGVPYSAQQFTPSSTMMMAQQQRPQQQPQQQQQQQQQRPPVAAAAGAGAGTQVRGGSYLQQAQQQQQQQQQQYPPAQYVHHMTSVPMSNMGAARPGVTPAYGNMQNLAVAQQHNMQARQKPNQVQTPGTQYIGGVTPGQQQALRQGPSIASQQQQQQALQQQQQAQMQQMNAQRLAPQQQQAMVRQTQTQQQQQQQQMLQMRVASGGPMWQGKPAQYQQQQPPQQQQQPQPPQQPPPQAQPRPPVAATAQARPATPQVPNPAPAEEPAGSILGKRSIQDLLAQIDPRERLDPDVEEVFLEIADDFIENVASFSCKIAQHRKSKVLEAKDVLLHLDKAYNITVPGFGGDEYRSYKRPSVSETHKQRLALVKKSAAAGQETKAAVANASTPVKAAGVATGASPTPSPGMPRIPRV